MIQDYEDILKCLRGKSVEDLTKVRLETPSFLTGMGPSRDGILIPADFGTDLYATNTRKRAQSSAYQVKLYLSPAQILLRSSISFLKFQNLFL